MGTTHSQAVGDELHIARSQVGVADPNGVITAGVIGQFHWDSANSRLYIANAADNSSWIDALVSTDEFLELTDTQSSYSGKAGSVLQVNPGETGVEFGQDLNIIGSPTFSQVTVGNAGLVVGASTPFSDAAGVLTLQNVDALDAATEATIETAIDALANLVSIQGQAVSLSGPLTVESASVVNQDLTTDASPTFANLIVSGLVDGRDISVDGALNDTHRASSGVDHGFIDQDVTVASSPQFASLVLTGDLTVQGTTTTLDTTTLLVEDRNIELGNVATPTDVTADGGGITLKASIDKTIKWVNAKNAWEFNQSVDLLGNNLNTTGVVTGGRAFFDNFGFDNNEIFSLAGDLDVTTQSGGVFKFTTNAIRAGLDAIEYVEMGHGGGNSFINAVGDGDLEIRFDGVAGVTAFTDNSLRVGQDATNLLEIGHGALNAFIIAFGTGGLDFRFDDGITTKVTFTDSGHLHLLTDVDQRDVLKLKTFNNLNDTGISWQDAFGFFTHSIYRTDTGNNQAGLAFAAGQELILNSLTNSFIIHGSTGLEGKLEILGALQISSGTPAIDRVLTSDLNGNATWQPLPQSVGWIAAGSTVSLNDPADSVRIGTGTTDSKLHVTSGSAGVVTAFAGTIATFESSGAGYLSILTPDVSTSGILFGEPSSNLAGAIFYNDPGSPDGFQFRVNGNQTKMVIESDGAVGIGTTNPDVTSILDLSSTTKGFLPPRMTTVQRDSISSPLAGLKIHNMTVDKSEVFTGISWKTVLTEDLGQVVVQETFASANVRFFGELALPAAQGWTDTATGIATIDLVTQTVFGEVKQVVRHNDDTTGGSTTSKIILTAQNWIDVNNFGASYSGTARLDTVNGASGFFSGLQANAAENPLATGNRRYGILFDSAAGNLKLVEADNNPGNSVTMDGTGGNPLVPFDEWFRWECVVPAGLGAAEVYINGILTTFVPTFIVNGGGLGTQIIVSSGSTGGANRIAYHDNFGVTIFEESATKTLAVATMVANVAQVNIPEARRDYTIILPDGNPREIGAILRLVANNVGGSITLKNENSSVPEILYNGLRELLIDVSVKEIIDGINTVNSGNVYIGFKAEDVDRSSSIFAQLHSIVDQIPTDVNPIVITYTNHDAINGIGHSTTINTGELEILPGFEGTYFVMAQPQVGKDSGGVKVDFDMFLQVDRGAGFIDEPNSNIKLTIKDSDITDTIVSAITIQLQVGDKIRMMQLVSNAAVGMGLKNTDPVVGPPTVPRTPSIIFTMSRVGGI